MSEFLGHATVAITMDTCAHGMPIMQQDTDSATRSVSGVDDVTVELIWDPPWTPERVSEDAKFILGVI